MSQYQKKMIVRGRGGRPQVVYQALGDATACGSGQTWYPNLVYAGQKGICATPDQAASFLQSNQATGNLSFTADDSAGGGFNWGGVGTAAGNLLGGLFGPKPGATGAPVVVQSGISTTTVIAIGGAALLGVFLLTKKRK